MNYGKELLLDIHNCDPSTFNRKSIRRYLKELCNLINMKRESLHWWDDYGVPPEERETEPHLVGTTAVQFIRTSNIVIHTLDLLDKVYINIFSCKDFNEADALKLSVNWFKGKVIHTCLIERK